MRLRVVMLALSGLVLAATARAEDKLRSFDELRTLGDRAAISRALFAEIGRILHHPRCANCHAPEGIPLQGESGAPHQPTVKRGPKGEGVTAMRCRSCHQTRNYDAANIPGAELWRAPQPDMQLKDRPLPEICRQWKDPKRTGELDLKAIIKHLKEDPAVAWSWNPGGTRTTPPGSQQELARYAQAWLDTGAVCPEE